MSPQEKTNFLIEVTPEVYSEINRLLEEDDYNSIVLHYSPYWSEFRQKTICRTCSGQGGDRENGPFCSDCDGTGEVTV